MGGLTINTQSNLILPKSKTKSGSLASRRGGPSLTIVKPTKSIQPNTKQQFNNRFSGNQENRSLEFYLLPKNEQNKILEAEKRDKMKRIKRMNEMDKNEKKIITNLITK